MFVHAQEAFGEVRVPAGFDYPRPQRLTAMSGIHKVASDRIYVVDAQTFLLPNFTYDGAAPGMDSALHVGLVAWNAAEREYSFLKKKNLHSVPIIIEIL